MNRYDSPADYAYLRDGEAKAPGIDDATGWEELTSRLQLTGFDEARWSRDTRPRCG